MHDRFRSTFLVLVFGALLFGTTACGGDDPPGGEDPECTGDERRCSDDGRIEVCNGGAFQILGGCPTGTVCEDGWCESEQVCEPNCAGRVCGGDGCGGSCGACDIGEACNVQGQCVDVPLNCGDGVCDSDEDCALCPEDCGQCCGDGFCDANQGETCQTCPADCGMCCGDGTCDTSIGENCSTCPADCGCGTDGVCDPVELICVCEPDCSGRVCGDDGCGGTCGSGCSGDDICNAAGQCVDPGTCQPDCAGRVCGADGCGGTCGTGCTGDDVCDSAGQCIDPGCDPDCSGKVCGPDGCGGSCAPGCGVGESCTTAGQCEGGGTGGCDACTGDQVCIDDRCRDAEVVCSASNPTGLCESGYSCVEGECVSSGSSCSPSNPAGVCPIGYWCDGGVCEPIDDEALCDDGNACTVDWYDGARNRCVNEPDDGLSCSDGNACTTNWCEDGVCMAESIGGCVAPPTIDPYVTPTNVGSVTLSGTKPANSSIEINGNTAVDEDPLTEWSVNRSLAPGENTFVIRSRQGTTPSETVEVRIVYDITPPITTVTPGGGTFRNGVTVQVSTNEPATVYYTTDGSIPDQWSPSFQSVRSFRVTHTTLLRFRARDIAGNWEEEVVTADFVITAAGSKWQAGPTIPAALLNPGVAVMDESIFVVGGSSGAAPQAGGHAYDYVEGTWSAVPPMSDGRAQLALVSDGTYLYAIGGEREGDPLNLVTRWRPGEASWTSRQGMPTTRFGHAAIHHEGEIHVFGGKASGGTVLTTHEIYSPSANNWTSVLDGIPRPRYAFGAVLYERKVYLVGGEDASGNPVAEVDIYDLDSGDWTQGPDLPTPRSFAAVSVMRNVGEVTGGHAGVVVAGGRTAGGVPSAIVEEYLIEEGIWRDRTPLDTARHSGGAVRVSMPDTLDTFASQVWFMGGQVASGPTGSSVVYTRDQDYVRRLPPLPEGRFEHAAAALDGRIYIFGGRYHSELAGGWAFDPETGTYEPLPDLPTIQKGHVGLAFGDLVYSIGGANENNNAVSHVRAFDPMTWSWQTKQPMTSPRRDAAGTIVGDEIYVIGGYNNGAVQTVEIYHPATNNWRSGPLLPSARTGAMAVTVGSEIYVLGGLDNDGNHHTSQLRLDTAAATPSWVTHSGDSLTVAHGTAVHVGGGDVVVLGGRTTTGRTRGIWNYYAPSRQVRIAEFSNKSLLEAYDHSAAVYLNGKVYIIGGNADDEPSPVGRTAIQEVEPRCFARNQSPPQAVACGSHAIWPATLPSGWTTGGAALWTRTTDAFSIGYNAMRSQNTASTSRSWISRTVTFPNGGAIEFDWRHRSGHSSYSAWMFYCERHPDSATTECTSGTAADSRSTTSTTGLAWQTRRRELSPGTYTFDWVFQSEVSNNTGSRGWIDNVRFIHY
jgi:N-acetylneuraminic acid mutarotase